LQKAQLAEAGSDLVCDQVFQNLRSHKPDTGATHCKTGNGVHIQLSQKQNSRGKQKRLQGNPSDPWTQAMVQNYCV